MTTRVGFERNSPQSQENIPELHKLLGIGLWGNGVRVTQELGETVWVHQEGVLGERNESLLRLCAESQ